MIVLYEYLKTRMVQKSTWLGLSAIIASLAVSGGTITPEVVVSALTAIGLIDVNA